MAGDHLQLSPILKGIYPTSRPRLFGSILACLRTENNATEQDPNSQIEVQLQENFRMNQQLCSFVEHIYRLPFQPESSRRLLKDMGKALRQRIVSSEMEPRGFLQGMCEVMEDGNTQLMRKPVVESNKVPATNMFVLNLRVATGTNKFLPIETHRLNESTVVSYLVQGLARTFPEDTISVVTPHRIQRCLVTKKLGSMGLPVKLEEMDAISSSNIWIDTTEKLQGFLNPDNPANERL